MQATYDFTGAITRKGAGLAQELAQDCPKAIAWGEPGYVSWTDYERACSLLCRHAQTLAGHAEAACCRERSASEEHREALTEARVRAICAALGWGVEFNGDPRGFAVKLKLPSGRYNTWGGAESGWGI